LETLAVGDHFAIEDGFYEFVVVEKPEKHVVVAEIQSDGVIKHRKSLNLIGKDVDLPSLIDEDLNKLNLATKARVDFVALSFTRTKKDIEILRYETNKLGLDVKIIAKIENKKGLDNIDELIDCSDGVMIARGDLGIETPIEQLTYYQKEIINKCRDKAKTVIVATQMLQSMVEKPLPSRAEAADVANAAFDFTDCVMLSEETAIGKYPVKSVDYMKRILKFNEEKATNYFNPSATSQTHAIIKAGLEILKQNSGAEVDKAIILTESGRTARILSSYRPKNTSTGYQQF